MASRRPTRWHPPPPPTPKILNLPRRGRRFRIGATVAVKPQFPKPTARSPASPPPRAMPVGRLEPLLQQERTFTSDRRRARVEHEHVDDPSSSTQSSPGGGQREAGKWKFQAEMLRAECNFLRLERAVTVRKEAALRSAVDSLVSGRRKIDGSDNAGVVMKELERKLERLGISRKRRSGGERRDTELRWVNFDKKALLLRRRLQEMNVRDMMPKKKNRDEKVDDDHRDNEKACVREIKVDTNGIQEKRRSSGAGVSVYSSDKNSTLSEVETMRRKMSCISKGMLQKMEVYDTILSSSTATSTTTTWPFVVTAAGNGSTRTIRNEALNNNNKAAAVKESPEQPQRQECFGRCRAVLGRITQEVKAETEQWGEMQGMLEQVREEMDDLRRSRDFWERCAVQSDQKLRTANPQVVEWRQRARASEQSASELQRQVMELRSEVDELKDKLQQRSSSSFSAAAAATASTIERKEKENEKAKRVLSCGFMNGDVAPLRPRTTRTQPLREICNLSTVKSTRRLRA